MRFIVLFEDDASAGPDVRRRHMPAHLAFLEVNANKIRAAGPLSAPDGASAGGLWLMDVDTPEEIEALVREDPFWPTGLRKSVRILTWNQVFADGQRLIAV